MAARALPDRPGRGRAGRPPEQQGVKVEDVHRPWEGLRGVIVAEVTGETAASQLGPADARPAGDRAGEARVAAGVANWEVGDLFRTRRRVRGFPSWPNRWRSAHGRRRVEGMIARRTSWDLRRPRRHPVLPADLPIGADVAAMFGLDDVVLDVEIEPNRPDLMSVLASPGRSRPRPACRSRASRDRRGRCRAVRQSCATVEVLDLERCPGSWPRDPRRQRRALPPSRSRPG